MEGGSLPESIKNNTEPLVVAIALIEREGRYLITKRLPEDSFGGLWEFPGGKLDPGEKLEGCLAREIREELGVEVTVGTPVQTVEYKYTTRLLRFHCFACTIREGEPRPIECSEIRWVTAAELDGFTFPPASGPIIKKLQGGRNA
jgi:A/G-specific adenine glycosylase